MAGAGWREQRSLFVLPPAPAAGKKDGAMPARRARGCGVRMRAGEDMAVGRGGVPRWLPAFGAAAAAGALFGFDIGATSGVVRLLGQPGAALGGGVQLDAAQLGAVASASLLGALLSSALALRFGDDLGRKRELQLAAVAYTLGLGFEALPGATDSVPSLLAARVLVGVGIGLGMHVAPTYIAETAPAKLRGPLLSFKEACIVLGILGGYVSGWAADLLLRNTPELAWHATYAVGLLVAVPLLVGSPFLRESPRWLALRALGNGDDRQLDDAREAFRALAGDDGTAQADAEFDAVVSSLSPANTALDAEAGGRDAREREQLVHKPASTSAAPTAALSLEWGAAGRRALVMGLGLVVFQQITGQPSVLYYANRIFEDSGYGFEAAVGLGVFKLAATLAAAAFVERAGRRSLLLGGCAGMTACLAALSAVFSGGDAPSSQTAAVLAILGFVGFYQIGFGPCTWLVLSEVFPLRVRSAALGIASLLNFGSNLVVTAVFEQQRKALGSGTLFAVLAVLGATSVIFVAAYIIETRGLSLEEVQAKLEGSESAQ